MICDKSKCTGCFACYNICPKKAINMVEDDNGFIYPEIDKDKCINCDLCKKVCPSINEIKFNKPLKCYAMQAKEKYILKQSTSGGASAIFAKHIIDNNGVVYGASFIKGFKIEHIRIDNSDNLNKIKGSKYVHCYVNDVFKNVKKDLLNNLTVLFTGTPCQIAGLKKFLMKDYDNLYCVDIICHGVPSQKYLKDEIETSFDSEKLDELKFRVNDEFRIQGKCNNKIVVDKPMNESKYYLGFIDSFFYRENCYDCKFAKSERVSDITIGDFWGINEDSKFFKDKNLGLSVLLPNTEKGLNLILACKDNMNLEERDLLEAVLGNTQLRNSSKIHRNYYKYKKMYPKYGFEKSYLKTRKLEELKLIIKNNKFIYTMYIKFKRMIRK